MTPRDAGDQHRPPSSSRAARVDIRPFTLAMLLMPTAHECLSAPQPSENIYAAVLRQAAERREQFQQHVAEQIARIQAKADQTHGRR